MPIRGVTIMNNKYVQHMLDNDAFSKWLGIEVVDVDPGYCKLRMEVREEMTNGFHVAHGGIAFSLADSALAFAANSHGRIAMSVENSINYTDKIAAGDRLIAIAEELKVSNRIGHYRVSVMNQNSEYVAFFNGTVYRTMKEFDL